MHPYLIKIPLPWGRSFPIASYGFMILLGFLLSLWLLRRRGQRLGIDPNAMFDAATFMLLGGIIGARVFYVIENWQSFAQNPGMILRLDKGGLAFYGGLLGGGVGLLGTIFMRRMPLSATVDTVASVVPFGHMFGRFGCFLNGCCFGKVTSCWTGVRFPRILDSGEHLVGSLPYQFHIEQGLVTVADAHSLPVHPTQLYEAGYNLLIFGVLTWVLRHRRRPGDVGWTYLLLYGSCRFVNEFFRGDHQPLEFAGGLTMFQLISAAAAAAGLALLVRSRRLPVVPLPDPWQPPEAQ